MQLTFIIVTNVLRIITILLHLIGSYLLTSLYKNGAQNPEQLFLINLSVSEIVFNFFDILSTPLQDVTTLSANETMRAETVQGYIIVASGYGVVPVYFLSMIYLTIDRLLEIVLCLKYHMYCTVPRTQRILVLTWVITVGIGLMLCLIHGYTNADLINPLVKFVYPVFEIVFIIIAFITYGFLFHKYRMSRIPPAQVIGGGGGRVVQRQPTVLEVFQTSRFHVPMCLIASFLVFITIADLMYSFGIANGYNKTTLANDICRISIVIGCLIDAIIYIFLNPIVLNLLLKKLRNYRRLNRIGIGG